MPSQGFSVQAGLQLGRVGKPLPMHSSLAGPMARGGVEVMAVPAGRRRRKKESAQARRARRGRADARTFGRIIRACQAAASHHGAASSLVAFLRCYLEKEATGKAGQGKHVQAATVPSQVFPEQPTDGEDRLGFAPGEGLTAFSKSGTTSAGEAASPLVGPPCGAD